MFYSSRLLSLAASAFVAMPFAAVSAQQPAAAAAAAAAAPACDVEQMQPQQLALASIGRSKVVGAK